MLPIGKYPVHRLNPSLASAHNNLGVAHRRSGEYVRAIAEFSRAIELNPSYAAALNNRGEVFLVERRYAEAARDFSAVLAIDPGHATAARNLALTNRLLSLGENLAGIHTH
jgi:tetratricopeptide (TPR) repeat protein